MEKPVYVYIDGFNLYHGAVEKTHLKWLDLCAFARKISGTSEVLIKYFTANVGERGDPGRPQRQQIYLRALETLNRDCLQIIKGEFRTDPKCLPLAYRAGYFRNQSTEQFTWVMRTEEKGSDVNLAVHLVNDGWRNCFDCALVISNDSDLYEAIRIVRSEMGKAVIIANPRPDKRPVSKLRDIATKVCSVTIEHLIECQLPDPIPGTNIFCPPSWKPE